jgi:hypothetical protein
VFPKMFMIREKQLQIFPILENYSVIPPTRTVAPPPCFANVYNKLTGGGQGCCVSLSEHPAYLAPNLCLFCLVSFVLSASPIATS